MCRCLANRAGDLSPGLLKNFPPSETPSKKAQQSHNHLLLLFITSIISIQAKQPLSLVKLSKRKNKHYSPHHIPRRNTNNNKNIDNPLPPGKHFLLKTHKRFSQLQPYPKLSRMIKKIWSLQLLCGLCIRAEGVRSWYSSMIISYCSFKKVIKPNSAANEMDWCWTTNGTCSLHFGFCLGTAEGFQAFC